MKSSDPCPQTHSYSSILAALAVAAFAIAPPSARAATQYATGAFTWDNGTTTKWSATSGGPYTSVWTSGNDAVLEGTAGTLTLSSPTVENINFNTTGFILSGASTLTLAGTTPTLFLGSGISATVGNNTGTVLGGSVGLTKGGLGTLTLSNNTVNTFTGGLNVNGGTLAETFANLTTPTDLINNGNVLTLAGGTLSLTGKGSAVTSQTFASTTLNSGGSVVTLTQNSATSLTAALGAITRNAGGTLNFSVVPNTTTVLATTSTSNEGSGILGPWASVGATTTLQYAANNGSGKLISYASATAATAADLSNVTNAAVNYSFAAAATQTGNTTGNTLRYTGAAATLTDDGFSTTLNGLMNAGTGALTVGATVAGYGQLVIGANKELVITANGQATNINAQIVDNPGGASTLVYNGAGSTLTLNYLITSPLSHNTYSGGTIINSGSLSTAATGNSTDTYLGSGPITVNPGATLALNRTYLANTLTLNNATITCGNSFASTLTGQITLVGLNTLNVSGGLTFSSNITGTGGLIKTNSSAVTVAGTTINYTGPTIINGGSLIFPKASALYNGNSAYWTPAYITVGNGGAMIVNVGGTGEFTASQAGTLFGGLGTVSNNGLLNGSSIGFNTGNAGATVQTISATITDSTGTGGGVVGLKHYGASGTTLELTGANTFSGTVVSDNNGTLKVSSINSVTTNAVTGAVHSASSSLGAPTTIANGTISIGSNRTFQGGNLLYTGTGEITDRVINLGGANSTSYTFDHSGTGTLKFLSAFTLTDNRGPKTITLQGSTAGIGEIAGAIPFGQTGNPNAVTKAGTGTWRLSAGNLYGGVTSVNGGCLELLDPNALPGGIGVTGGTSALTFNGGVIGLGNGDFTRSLAAAGTVTGVNFTGNGGWAAYGANRAVNLGGASAQVAWATASTGLNGKTLILGNATATHTVDFQNPLDLGAATRTVQVDKGAATIDAKLSGSLTNGSLTQTGTGTLLLPGTLNYAGATTVSGGTMLVSGTNSGASAVTVGNNATFGGTGSIAGAATFSTGGKAVFTLTPDPVTLANTTPLAIAGVMTFNATVVHINAPANLPSGTYTLATSGATPTGTLTATPVLDSGSYATGFTSAVVSLDTTNNLLVLTVNGLPTTPTQLRIASINGGVSPTAGLPFTVVVQSVDANGLLRNVTSNTQVLLFVKTGTGSLSGNFSGTIAAGTNSVNLVVNYDTAESGVSFTASDDSLAAADSSTFTVIPDTTPTSLTVSGFPNPNTAGLAGDVTVTAKTPSGNVATSYVGTVHFTSNDGLAVLPADYTFVPADNGVHTFPSGATLKTAGSTLSITATDTVTPTIAGSQSGITVLPGAATTMTVAGFPSPHAVGVAGSVTVTVKDAYNNLATNYTGTVAFTSNDALAVLPSNYLFDTIADHGTHTFSVTLNTTGTTQSITATDINIPTVTGTQSGITVWVPPTSFTWATTNGNWSVPANWSPYQTVSYAPITAGEADYSLNFGTGSYTATNNLSDGFLVNQINFLSGSTATIGGAYAIALTANGGTLPTINQNSANSVQISAPLALSANTTVGGTGTGNLVLAGNISGGSTLILNVPGGLLTLYGTNNYSGGTTVNAGTLAAGNTGNSYFGTGTITMNSGTTFALNGNGNLLNAIVLNHATATNGNGYTAGLNGPVQLGGICTLDVSLSGNMAVGGVISDVSGQPGSLIKAGSSGGPLVLNNANTYTGATTISAGTLTLGASGSINTTSGISLAAATTFDVSAKTSPYAWSAGTTLSAAGAGTFVGTNAARIIGRSGGQVDLSLAPSINLTFSPLFSTGDTTHPALYVSQGGVTLNNNAFTVNNAGPALGAGTYRLIQVGDGSTGVVTEAATPAYALTISGNGLKSGCTATLSVSSGNLIMTVISDPFDSWIKTYFPTANDPNAAKDADPDGDGLNNLQEFAFDGNPNVAMPSGKVRSHVVTSGSDEVLVLTLPVRGTTGTPAVFTTDAAPTATIDHVKYTILGSADLATNGLAVTEITAETDMPALDTGWTYHSFRLTDPLGSHAKGFMKVLVEPAP